VDDQRVAGLQQEVQRLQAQVRAMEVAGGSHALGHFYSPIPSSDDIESRLIQLQRMGVPRLLPEIDLGVERQLAFLDKIKEAIGSEILFPEQRTDDFRYYFENTQYGYNDAITLHGILRSLRPKRLIEVGSGFSSALVIDTNERYLEGTLSCTFIEPFTERLDALLRDSDRQHYQIFKSKVQNVDSGVFASLEANDILFIDSSHVAKYGSDLEYLLREVLPLLAPGVFIHFHDIFYPFEYPEPWIRGGHFWNECYMLRAFLANNASYRIELFTDYIAHFYRDHLEAVSPLCLKNTGANLWLSKTARSVA
jgi:hypothetical protein